VLTVRGWEDQPKGVGARLQLALDLLDAVGEPVRERIPSRS
jgi:hypothetical protein